ncbi:serine/threonine-protein kinase/endoribonuclease IRE1b-like [Pyrus communis]|uniref:serine/threonine-protein kinase/endoribonuclease IRE1b-like n=1 Tax=Pyrus communis TaxID=23211 RepID=UPI0035C1BFC1
MRRPLIFLLLFAPLIECLTREAAITVPEPETSTGLSIPHSSPSNRFNSLLPKLGNDITLVVALDGTIYMVNTNPWSILWGFSSGAPIHTSYQDASFLNNTKSDDHFIDLGEDGALYSHTRSGKEKLSSSVEEFIGGAPYWSKDGGVTTGSRRNTVFLVDAKTGKLIHMYKSADTPSKLVVWSTESDLSPKVKDAHGLVESGSIGLETVEHMLYIVRTDYEITHYSSGKVVWSMTFATFESRPQISNAGNELALRHSGVSDSILPSQNKTYISRTLDPILTEYLSKYAGINDSHSGDSSAYDHSPNVNVPALIEENHPSHVPAIIDENHPSHVPAIIEGNHPSGGNEGIMAQAVTKLLSLCLTLLSIVVCIFRCPRAFGKQHKLKQVAEETKMQAGVPKKKRTRRLGNNKRNSIDVKNMSNTSHEDKVGESKFFIQNERSEMKFLLTSADHLDGQIEGRRIGKLCVSNNEIAQGSNGTIVLEGIYDGRPVAVKRLVRTHHDVAFKEVQNLIASDQHPNIVRWHGVEYDQDFVYLSLERCTCSLYDLIYFHSGSIQSQITTDQDPRFWTEYTTRLHSMMGNNKDIELWKANGYPSPQLLKLMSDLVSGLAHLHELGIIHRDLKPQNVLIIKGRSLCAKLSDMGISKRLQGDKSSITQHATGYGSSGWQAPEQLLHLRQTRAVDLFSLGCLLFFCVTGGKHPYGDSIERDVNIVNDRKDLFLVDTIPEAVDLFTRLLNPNPDLRPTSMDVLHHPFFWSSETRLSFIRDASDRVELEDRENESELLNSLESTAAVALNGKWDEKMESAFINNIGRYRRYKFDSVRDLLRVIRNKLNHYRELPEEVKEILGPVPEGFDGYFSSRFPKLLIEVYKVLYRYCKEEEFFCKYIKSNQM